MAHSQTFITPTGHRVASRAHKVYAVVCDSPEEAKVVLRTDDFQRALRELNKNNRNRRSGSPVRMHLFRRSDGAHLCPVTTVRCS